GRAVVRPGESVPLLQQPLAHDRDKDKSVNEAIEPRQLDLVRHRRNQVVGRKSVVRRATRKEALISLDVDGIGGRAGIESRLGARRKPRSRRVGKRAGVLPSLGYALPP